MLDQFKTYGSELTGKPVPASRAEVNAVCEDTSFAGDGELVFRLQSAAERRRWIADVVVTTAHSVFTKTIGRFKDKPEAGMITAVKDKE